MPSRAQVKAAQQVKLPGSTQQASSAPGGQPPMPSRAQVKAAQQVSQVRAVVWGLSWALMKKLDARQYSLQCLS